MAGCGVDPRWLSGCSAPWAVRSLLNAGGITCSGWATVRACRVPSMPKRTRKSSRLLKKLPEQVEDVRAAHPQATIELWSMDEHRIGLGPILRRGWAPTRAAIHKATCPHLLMSDVY